LTARNFSEITRQIGGFFGDIHGLATARKLPGGPPPGQSQNGLDSRFYGNYRFFDDFTG
jgi:hypothetical protein